MDIKQGYLTGRSLTTQSVILGFVPDHVDLQCLGSRLVAIHWDGGVLEDTVSGVSPVYGFAEMGTSHLREDASEFCAWSGASDCYEVPCGGAAYGISAHDVTDEFALIPSPAGGKEVPMAVNVWVADSVLTGASRTATVCGVVNRPTLANDNGFVYEAVAIDGGASACDSTEPTWPKVPGQSVVDNDIDWVCRVEKVVRAGGKGFVIGQSVIVDGEIAFFTAYRGDTNKYIGSAQDTGEVYLV